jgi:hypothetical protein
MAVSMRTGVKTPSGSLPNKIFTLAGLDIHHWAEGRSPSLVGLPLMAASAPSAAAILQKSYDGRELPPLINST